MFLGYWKNALSVKALGENAFAMRLPSALSAGLSALMLFFLIRRFTKNTVTAMMSTAIFLTCIEVYVIGTFCVLDSMFSMFITASMAAFFLAFMESRPLKRNYFLIISGVACGFAFLTK